MIARGRKFVLLLALSVIPVQGIAGTLSVLLCHGDAQAHAMHAPGSHDPGVRHDGHQDKGGATGHNAYHPCSHYTGSILPIIRLPAVLPDFPVRAFALDPLHDLFIPEQPDRPPLA